MRSLLDPRFVMRFLVAVNLPDSKTLGSTPAKATSFLGLLNRSISPISEIIVAAIFSPIPGIDLMILYSSISLARALSLSLTLIDALCTEENIYIHT